MENYYEPDERIIATTIPPFARNKKTSQTQIRIKEDGVVIYREFQRMGLEFEKIDERQSQVSPSAVATLVSKIAGLMKLSDSMPVIDDTGSREIALHHADGAYESIQFPNSGGRKHPSRKPFEDAWGAIEGASKSNSEVGGGGNSASLRASP
jgi:hypothetical protein